MKLTFAVAFSCCIPLATMAASEPCATYIEEHERGKTASVRTANNCTLDEKSYQQLVAKWLAARSADAASVERLFMGRAVKHPWISEQIARTALRSDDWRAKPSETHVNALVASFLSEAAFRQRLAAPFRNSAYLVESVHVEKVLVGVAAEVLPESAEPSVRVPYDAMIWLELRER